MLEDEAFRIRDRSIDGERSRAFDGIDWTAPYRGVRVPAALSDDVRARIRAAGLLVPNDFAIGDWAAAHLHGDRWAHGLDAAGQRLPVRVFGPRPQGIRPRAELDPRRASLAPTDVVEVDGLRVTSAVRTAFDRARYGRTLDRALPPVDALLRAGVLTTDEFRGYVDRHPRTHGVPLARLVASWVSPFAESMQESRMRLL